MGEDLVGKIFQKFLNIFFPDNLSCIICEKDIYNHRYSMCDECLSKLSFITGKTCRLCGRKLSNSYEGSICDECLRFTHYFEKGVSCVSYNDFAKDMIINFKYYHKRYIGRYIGEIMSDYLKGTYIDDIDIVTAVPISRKKEKFKGYNHSHIIGKNISKICRKEYVKDLIIRNKDTIPLKELTRNQREMELSNVFEFNDNYVNEDKNKTILLVDDIYTTGSTLNECSRILKKSGYNNIIVMTFSIGNL